MDKNNCKKRLKADKLHEYLCSSHLNNIIFVNFIALLYLSWNNLLPISGNSSFYSHCLLRMAKSVLEQLQWPLNHWIPVRHPCVLGAVASVFWSVHMWLNHPRCILVLRVSGANVSLSVCTKPAITFSPADRHILAHSDILVSLGLLFLAGSVLCVCVLCVKRGRASQSVCTEKERSKRGVNILHT